MTNSRLTMDRRQVLQAAGLLLAGLGLAACGDGSTKPGPDAGGGADWGSDAARVHVDPASADSIAFGTAQRQFAFNMLDALANDKSNTVISPYSIASVLAMLLQGAGGTTAQQFLSTLTVDGDAASVAPRAHPRDQ